MDIASFMSTTSSLKRRKKERKMKKMKEDKWEGKGGGGGKAPSARQPAPARRPPTRWIESLSRQPVVTLRRRRSWQRGNVVSSTGGAADSGLAWPTLRRGGSVRPSVVVASWDRRRSDIRTTKAPPPLFLCRLRLLNIKQRS